MQKIIQGYFFVFRIWVRVFGMVNLLKSTHIIFKVKPSDIYIAGGVHETLNLK